MNDHLQHVRYIRENDGVPAALQYACERIVQTEEQLAAAFRSQFLERTSREDGSKFLRQVSEQYVSNSFDMADCGDPEDEQAFFWCDPATGELHHVTVGSMCRHDMGERDIIFGSSDLIANGRAVGTILHTDH